jgi:hypothetical protein
MPSPNGGEGKKGAEVSEPTPGREEFESSFVSSPASDLFWLRVVFAWVADVVVAGRAGGLKVARIVACYATAEGVVHLRGFALAHPWYRQGAHAVVAAMGGG